MTQEKIFKILAANFAMRAVFYHGCGEHGIGTAYNDAFDMLAYAAEGRWDCLSQFSWMDEAEELVDKIGEQIDFWELEEIVKTNEEVVDADDDVTEEWACTPDTVDRDCWV